MRAASMPSRSSVSTASRFELGIERRDRREIDRVLVHDLGDDVIGAPVDREQAEGGEIAGIGRHDAGLHAEQVHHRRRLRRPGAAEGEQREAARIDAALDGHLADGVGLVPVGDLDDAVRERFGAHGAGQPLGQRRQSGARTRGRQRDAAADQGRRDAAEHQIGVGDGRLVAAVG